MSGNSFRLRLPQETSLLNTMSCLRQPSIQPNLSPPCSRAVDNSRLFACVPEAQQACPDITSLNDMKGCIMQHNLKCSTTIESGDVPENSSSLYPMCSVEIESLCRDASQEGLYDCLHDHEDSVSKQCKKSLKMSVEHRCKDERISLCLNHFGQVTFDCEISFISKAS